MEDPRIHRRSNHAILRKLHVWRGGHYLCLGRGHAGNGARVASSGTAERSLRGHDVGQRDVAVELEIGRHDDGLGPIVRFRRNGKDRLLRVGGVSRLRFGRFGGTVSSRWQIFFRRIRYQRRPVKCGPSQNFLLPNPRERNRIDEGHGRRVQQRGLQEAPHGSFCWTKTSRHMSNSRSSGG